ncbi:hypothetical protein PV04_01666 [Phialophora macrospora]|uniref:Uncharacterized protein n=1 Tax=Phialophora macrospora TaxID=1851006 RepID=A0A0D2D7N0_9EURO|nr:hypothetical protein PV04_01666 [Phialophora macrospora]
MVSLVNSIPAANESPEAGQSCTNVTDTFDEVGFVTSSSKLLGTLGGIIPQSSPNLASATILNDLLQLGPLTLQPFGNITASPSKYFDIYSGWLACTLMQGSSQVPGLPLGCTVTVSGIDKDSNTVPAYTTSFSPTNVLANPMAFFQLPDSFRNLISVTFGVATSGLLPATTALFLDNVSMCTYS